MHHRANCTLASSTPPQACPLCAGGVATVAVRSDGSTQVVDGPRGRSVLTISLAEVALLAVLALLVVSVSVASVL